MRVTLRFSLRLRVFARGELTPPRGHLIHMEDVKIIECPRDAWQGLPAFIPTDVKVAYLAALLDAGFRHIDAVSFVAPKYVPQMADSEMVMQALQAQQAARLAEAEIIGIVVNEQGLRRALATPGVTTIGYPYSISERFTRQNANMSQQESRQLLEKMALEIQMLRSAPGSPSDALAQEDSPRPNLAIYISMAFGNPYGDLWAPEIITDTLEWLQETGLKAVSLADTVGKARPEQVGEVFRAARDSAAGMEVGVHLHSRPEGAAEKVLAAYQAGCRRFDSALTGLGGCPFAGDRLVGNIPTEIVLHTLAGRGVFTGIELPALARAVEATEQLRAQYAHEG